MSFKIKNLIIFNSLNIFLNKISGIFVIMDVKKVKILMVSMGLILLGISMGNIKVQAHSPSTMSLSYDVEDQVLNVTITHVVNDPNTHYIDSITVKVNGTEVLSKSYTSQPSSSNFMRSFDILANEGATIEVRATCSVSGSLSKSTTVSAGSEKTSNTGDQTIEGFTGIFWMICLASFIIFIRIKKQSKKR